MTKFNELYDKILNEYSLDFTSPRLYIFQNILLEESQFLRNPKGLFQKVYQTILDLYKDKKYDIEVKLYVKDIINASFESDLKDSVKPLYIELKNIFGNSSLNYILFTLISHFSSMYKSYLLTQIFPKHIVFCWAVFLPIPTFRKDLLLMLLSLYILKCQ